MVAPDDTIHILQIYSQTRRANSRVNIAIVLLITSYNKRAIQCKTGNIA